MRGQRGEATWGVRGEGSLEIAWWGQLGEGVVRAVAHGGYYGRRRYCDRHWRLE